MAAASCKAAPMLQLVMSAALADARIRDGADMKKTSDLNQDRVAQLILQLVDCGQLAEIATLSISTA
jgi:hypothetical protein